MAAGKNPLDPHVLFEHVQDAPYFHLPRSFAAEGADGHVYLPQPLAKPVAGSDHGHGPAYEPVAQLKTGVAVLDKSLLPLDLVLSKFMVIETLVLIISVVLFGWLASQIRRGGAARGKLANLLETFCVFIRDEVARPAIGGKDADDYLPFLWTLFFFVLGCNLFGMIPWMGSPTGSLAVTAVLALMTFVTVVGVGIVKYGFAGFLKVQVPHMDLPAPVAVLLVPMIFVIELLGLLIKHLVLAVRLLANMMAGHIVLAVLLGFIAYAAGSVAWWGVAPASVLGATALSLLELFVAFLQAYIFVFLSALFIGAVVHPH
ncbi:F0F1 ATP synthase subunit A [Botrimarina hoheduenensis]|uniref:ATP synthase subunit a n=1 Tax=Botrimarina hoheduenensis TaxID=2528000 RepID=A0A5C5WFG3_9BACT|nr:F0F1 ATP synthase subunit A [Botrimarina hoheduenensis]TWT48851.1 ATP synthase subunit a [Botrimarina hoheduenensis]